MNNAFGQPSFNDAQRFFTDVQVPENVAALAQRSVAQSKEFYAKGTAAAHDGAKAVTEIADTAWGSTKMLHEKIVQNVQANTEAAFAAAQAIAGAKSLPEIAQLQTQFLQAFTSQTSEQTKEFFDLSARAAQHVLEKMQAAAKVITPPTA
jgi:hypothetical protein